MRHGPDNGGARITYQASYKEVGRREGGQPHWSLQRGQDGTDDGSSGGFVSCPRGDVLEVQVALGSTPKHEPTLGHIWNILQGSMCCI